MADIFEEQAQKRLREREVKNQLQEQKRSERVARRAYRDGMRSGNYQQAMQALDWVRQNNGSSGAGIRTAGVEENRLVRFQGRLERMVGANNPTPRENRPVINRDSLGAGAYRTDKGSSMGWFDMKTGKPLQQAPQTANPNATPGAGYGTPLRSAISPTTPMLGAGRGVASPQDNLSRRISLFNTMVEHAQLGNDLSTFREEAASMGIDDASFERGASRAINLGGAQQPPSSTIQTPTAGLSLGDRLKEFSERNSGLLRRGLYL